MTDALIRTMKRETCILRAGAAWDKASAMLRYFKSEDMALSEFAERDIRNAAQMLNDVLAINEKRKSDD